jgi:hypothetical protein
MSGKVKLQAANTIQKATSYGGHQKNNIRASQSVAMSIFPSDSTAGCHL